MPIQFYCNQCYSQVITPDGTAGKPGRCPHCGAVVKIPGPGETTPRGPTPRGPTPRGPTQPGGHPGRFSGTPSAPSSRPPSGRPTSGSPTSGSPVDPFKPSAQQSSEYSESVQKQFGFKDSEDKKEQGTWGEDTELSYQLRKTIAKERAQNRLVGPAQTLITLAAVNLIAVILGIAALLIYLISQSETALEVNGFWLTLGIVATAIIMIDSTMIFVGGNHMRHARSYSMAYTGTIFALLPLNLLFFLTIPFGIWALSTLNNPDVAEGFKRR